MPNMNPKKCPMPEQAPDVRNKNFEEVTLGLHRRNGGRGSAALPELQEQALHDRLPGTGQDSGVHRAGR